MFDREEINRLRVIVKSGTVLGKTTVLDMLTELEARGNKIKILEREESAAKAVLTRHIVESSLDSARNAGIAIDAATKAVVALMSEAKIQRVRELVKLHEGIGMDYVFMDNLKAVLDGENNE